MSVFRSIFVYSLLITITALGIASAMTGVGNIGGEIRTPEIAETFIRNSSEINKMTEFLLREPDQNLLMPVKGVKVRQVADTWGGARSGGRSHQGQDIFARRGTPIYSATEGYVLRVGESNLGGKTVFVAGSGGRRYYYAHLEDFAADLKTGDWVTTETLLGYVGTSGNAKGTPPHLHFGVYGGGAVNPLPLLTDRA